jgi:thymidine kinase
MSITVILGSMFSGKTTELLRLGQRYTYANKRVLYVNHDSDTRYRPNAVATHDGQWKTALKCSSLESLTNIEEEFDVILVDEMQFFDVDDVFVLEDWAHMGKIVIAACLQSTMYRQPFVVVSHAIAKADTIVHLKAVCTCGNDASITKRTTPIPKDGSLVGGRDDYTAECRSCFNKHYRPTPVSTA